MAKYTVNFAQVRWIQVNIEADDEMEAQENAYDELPAISAIESGWGQPWTADYDEAMYLDDFYRVWRGSYNPRTDGEVVEMNEYGDDL